MQCLLPKERPITSSTGITWELLGKADCPVESPKGIRICILARSPGCSCAHQSLKSTVRRSDHGIMVLCGDGWGTKGESILCCLKSRAQWRKVCRCWMLAGLQEWFIFGACRRANETQYKAGAKYPRQDCCHSSISHWHPPAKSSMGE